MSEQIQEEKQRLTLDEISPLWAESLRIQLKEGYEAAKEFREQSGLSCGCTQFCVVGEAHKFRACSSDRYGCDECRQFSLFRTSTNGYTSFASIDWNYVNCKEEYDGLIKEFEDHWNKVHVK